MEYDPTKPNGGLPYTIDEHGITPYHGLFIKIECDATEAERLLAVTLPLLMKPLREIAHVNDTKDE